MARTTVKKPPAPSTKRRTSSRPRRVPSFFGSSPPSSAATPTVKGRKRSTPATKGKEKGKTVATRRKQAVKSKKRDADFDAIIVSSVLTLPQRKESLQSGVGHTAVSSHVAARSGEEQSTALREKITEAKRRLAQEGILNISGPKVAVADEVLNAIEEHKTVDGADSSDDAAAAHEYLIAGPSSKKKKKTPSSTSSSRRKSTSTKKRVIRAYTDSDEDDSTSAATAVASKKTSKKRKPVKKKVRIVAPPDHDDGDEADDQEVDQLAEDGDGEEEKEKEDGEEAEDEEEDQLPSDDNGHGASSSKKKKKQASKKPAVAPGPQGGLTRLKKDDLIALVKQHREKEAQLEKELKEARGMADKAKDLAKGVQYYEERARKYREKLRQHGMLSDGDEDEDEDAVDGEEQKEPEKEQAVEGEKEAQGETVGGGPSEENFFLIDEEPQLPEEDDNDMGGYEDDFFQDPGAVPTLPDYFQDRIEDGAALTVANDGGPPSSLPETTAKATKKAKEPSFWIDPGPNPPRPSTQKVSHAVHQQQHSHSHGFEHISYPEFDVEATGVDSTRQAPFPTPNSSGRPYLSIDPATFSSNMPSPAYSPIDSLDDGDDLSSSAIAYNAPARSSPHPGPSCANSKGQQRETTPFAFSTPIPSSSSPTKSRPDDDERSHGSRQATTEPSSPVFATAKGAVCTAEMNEGEKKAKRVEQLEMVVKGYKEEVELLTLRYQELDLVHDSTTSLLLVEQHTSIGLQAALQSAQSQMAEAHGTAEKLKQTEDALKEMEGRLEQSEAAYEILVVTNTDSKEARLAAQGQVEALQTELDILEREKDEIVKEKVELASQLQATEVELGQRSGGLEEREKAFEQLKTEHQFVLNQTLDHLAELEATREDRDLKAKELAALQAVEKELLVSRQTIGERLEHVEREKEDLLAQKLAAEEQVARLAAELVVERERTQADQQTISSLNEELTGKSAQLEDIESLRSLAEQQQETSVRYEKLCVDVEDLESRLGVATASVDALQLTKSDLERTIDTLNVQLHLAGQKMEDSSAQLAVKVKDVAVLAEELSVLQTSHQAIITRIEELAVAFQIPSPATSDPSPSTILDALSTRLRARDSSVTQLSNDLADKTDLLTSTKAALEQAHAELAVAEKDVVTLVEVREKMSGLCEVVGVEGGSDLSQLVEQVKKVVAERVEDVTELQEMELALRNEAEAANDKAKEATGLVSRLESSIEELNEKIASLEAAKSTAEAKDSLIDNLETSVTELKEEVSALQNELEEQKEATKEKNGLISSLESSVVDLTAKLADAKKKLVTLRRLSHSMLGLQQQATELIGDVAEETPAGENGGAGEPMVEEVA